MTTTPSSQFHSQLLLLPVILLVILAATAQAQGQQPMARPGCPDKCGNISIPFPFGIGKPGCFRPGFQVVCNHSSDPPRAFLADNTTFRIEAYSNDSQSYSNYSWSPLELVSISVATGEARVYAAVSYRCSTKNNESFSTLQEMDFSDSPFAVSATRNVLIGVGCLRAEAELTWAVDEFYGTCRADDALFSLDVWNGTCTGWGCCERILPPDKGSRKSFSLSVNTMEKGWWWKMSKPAKIGPWGGNGGSERDVQTKPTQLVSWVALAARKTSLDPTNYVTEISGTIGKFQWNDVVTSLKIVTLKWDKTYGRVNGTPFRIPVLDGGKIAGFFGRSGDVLDAIGVYVTP